MSGTYWRSIAFVLVITLAAPTMLWAQSTEVIFTPVKIDGPVHDPLQNSYWLGPFSETASVADFDNDGDYDIAAGRNWYEAPLWIKHEKYRSGAEPNGPETESNSEFALDVNGDATLGPFTWSQWAGLLGVALGTVVILVLRTRSPIVSPEEDARIAGEEPLAESEDSPLP